MDQYTLVQLSDGDENGYSGQLSPEVSIAQFIPHSVNGGMDREATARGCIAYVRSSLRVIHRGLRNSQLIQHIYWSMMTVTMGLIMRDSAAFVLLILCISFLPSRVENCIAYDCSNTKMNITSFSTVEVQPCNIPDLSKPISVPYAKLLQRKEHVPVIYSNIHITYHIAGCSWLDAAQSIANGVDQN